MLTRVLRGTFACGAFLLMACTPKQPHAYSNVHVYAISHPWQGAPRRIPGPGHN